MILPAVIYFTCPEDTKFLASVFREVPVFLPATSPPPSHPSLLLGLRLSFLTGFLS
jgi:hypothetical protein